MGERIKLYDDEEEQVARLSPFISTLPEPDSSKDFDIPFIAAKALADTAVLVESARDKRAVYREVQRQFGDSRDMTVRAVLGMCLMREIDLFDGTEEAIADVDGLYGLLESDLTVSGKVIVLGRKIAHTDDRAEKLDAYNRGIDLIDGTEHDWDDKDFLQRQLYDLLIGKAGLVSDSAERRAIYSRIVDKMRELPRSMRDAAKELLDREKADAAQPE